MKNRGWAGTALAVLLAGSLVIPPGVAADTGPQAGKVTNVIPAVNLERATQQMAVSTGMPVDWGDVINTGHLARARVTLDEGSVLNVGAESNLTIRKHDAGAQQTDLELNYGKVRATAVKQTKPGAKFEIRTPTGVAGVVGTDFYLDYEGFMTHVVVFEGSVRFCNLAGECVVVTAGMMSTIRSKNNPPSQPSNAPTAEVMQANTSTMLQSAKGVTGLMATHGALVGSALAVGIAAPIVAVRVVNQTSVCSSCAVFSNGGGSSVGVRHGRPH